MTQKVVDDDSSLHYSIHDDSQISSLCRNLNQAVDLRGFHKGRSFLYAPQHQQERMDQDSGVTGVSSLPQPELAFLGRAETGNRKLVCSGCGSRVGEMVEV
jgi:hypothetical protein